MTIQIQYDLFNPPKDRVDHLEEEIKILRQEIATLRKSQFARLNAMGKLILEMDKEKNHDNSSRKFL